MAKKRKVSNAVKRAPGGYTTLPVGEEGIPKFSAMFTTLPLNEETTFIAGEGQVLSNPKAEHLQLSAVSAEIPPYVFKGDPGDPYEIVGNIAGIEQVAGRVAQTRRARKRRK